MTKRSLHNRTVIITGASLGVGKACAQVFHREGARLVLVARRMGPLEELARELGEPERVLCVAADVSEHRALVDLVEQTRARFGAIYGLVNNAGAHFRGPVESREPDELATMIDVNLRAPIYLTRLVLPHLREAGEGFVVNVASQAGKLALEGAATYSASKMGLRAFTYALAEELRGTDITVSVVSPGPIDTGFIMENLDEVEDITFSQKICTADDVAQLVLASARDGRIERDVSFVGGKLATLAYLVPSVRRVLKPRLVAKGRRVKARLRKERGE